MDYLLHHLVDGYSARQEGLGQLLQNGLIDSQEFVTLTGKNLEEFRKKLHEWRVTERLACVAFAALFTFMALMPNDDDLQRRARRRGKRKDNYELTMEN